VTSAKTSATGLVLQLASSNLSAWLREQSAAEAVTGVRKSEARLERYRLCLQLARAVQYIHEKAVLHADIKPGNALVHAAPLQVQLADFGLSRLMTPNASERCDMLYTSCYRPAELRVDRRARTKLSPSLDIWALTCTFFDVLSKGGKRYLFPNPDEIHGLSLSLAGVRCAEHVARAPYIFQNRIVVQSLF
jgi:serine/threonine protein kinase